MSHHLEEVIIVLIITMMATTTTTATIMMTITMITIINKSLCIYTVCISNSLLLLFFVFLLWNFVCISCMCHQVSHHLEEVIFLIITMTPITIMTITNYYK